ncbi:acetyltransferase [Bacillus thuringiensis serovar andalousiensis]|uniref:Acetyltransferase n=1 Tax=Bacillus thuringiensis TaxID=1428 RepID=A0A9X6PZJ6_BACTU|nr:N-acetyltransferase family protein [Bacillus thuringiensis serovar chinensis CT-43]AGG05053.1 N-acetyltransferase family protein [Bacillus thuringiensis serovar thuringiensis str. IS5056]AHZ55009.1 N-acetyltransferase family protein [Bacillus thuringiensis serovar kurstaki str. YBT-1520]AIE37457.1 N-acetyltransferase family protein [Bacillus thuringiensis serovar kurstaki str. HD-1]KAB1347022.1 acetyltransferase [Bacillus thuringiensis]OIX23476.1 acetyltransferase [Bacillus thuringiensis se
MDIFYLLNKVLQKLEKEKNKRTINREEYKRIFKEVFDISLNKYSDKILERG